MNFFSNVNINSIPLRISFFTCLIVILTLFYLNYLVTDRFDTQFRQSMSDMVGTVTEAVSSNLLGIDLNNNEEAKVVSRRLNRFVKGSVLRIDLLDPVKKTILSSSYIKDIGKPLNSGLVEITKNENFLEQPFSIQLKDKQEPIKALILYNKINSAGKNYLIQLIVDSESALGKGFSITLFLGVISVFLTIIVFIVVFLITGKISTDIKQVANALESLSINDFEINLPNAVDEVKILNEKVLTVKSILMNKANQISQLENNNEVLSDRKFVMGKNSRNHQDWITIETVFTIVRFNELHQIIEGLKPLLRSELLCSLAENISDILLKHNGSIVNFHGSDFYLRFDGENNIDQACDALMIIRSRIPIFCSHQDIQNLSLRAVIKKGVINYGQIRSSSSDSQIFVSETVNVCNQILNKIGKDDILLVETDQEGPVNNFDRKKIQINDSTINANNLEFYLLGEKANPSKTDDSSESGQSNDPSHGSGQDLNSTSGGLAAILEETLNQ